MRERKWIGGQPSRTQFACLNCEYTRGYDEGGLRLSAETQSMVQSSDRPTERTGQDGVEQWTAQLRIAAGRAVEEAPQIGVAEAVDRRGRLVRIAILAEPVSSASEPFLDQFVRRVASQFDPASRSLTGALRQAIEAAHEELRAWNAERVPAEHALYGMTCMVLREDGPAFLAQVGPSTALLAGPPGLAGLRSISLYASASRSGTGARALNAAATVIGGDQPLAFSFSAAPDSDGAAGGWALLVTSNAASLLDPERRVALSRLRGTDALRQLYPALLSLRDAAALAVSFGDDDVSQPVAERNTPDSESALPPTEPQASDLTDAQIEFSDESPESRGSTSTTSLPQQLTLAAEGLAVDLPVNPFAARELALVQQVSPPLAAAGGAITQPVEPVFELSGAAPMPRERWDSPAIEPPRIPPLQRPSAGGGAQPNRLATARRAGLLLAAMLAILAGVAAVLLGPSLTQSDADELQTQIERARNSLAATHLAADTETARLALEDARSEIEAALALNPLSADALQLRDEIDLALAELGLIQAPGDLLTAADFSAFGPALALGAVTGGGDESFVLDDAGGRVFRLDAGGVITPIFVEGELLGVGDELRAARPISLAWQPTGQTAGQSGAQSAAERGGALWILDAAARLYRWTATGVLLVPTPELVRLGSVDAVATTPGGVYLLDGAGGAIWRFAVSETSDGVELSPPVRAVGRTDMLDARELRALVAEDGAVEFVVASSDGRLRRFSAEGERALAVGLSQRLISPASISLGAQSGLIYVVDRADGRLVAIGPGGEAVSVIQSAELAELRGAWVDENRGLVIYALADRLLEGRLPSGAGP